MAEHSRVRQKSRRFMRVWEDAFNRGTPPTDDVLDDPLPQSPRPSLKLREEPEPTVEAPDVVGTAEEPPPKRRYTGRGRGLAAKLRLSSSLD